MRSNDTFSSQRDAITAAREAIWGDVHHSKRAFIDPKNRPDVAFYDFMGLPVLAVAADVNGRLVVIYFDHYGRLSPQLGSRAPKGIEVL